MTIFGDECLYRESRDEQHHRRVSEEIIGKIFDPYFTTKGPQAGTGVGLFMSKTIIEKNMGGRLTVRNAEGGAEFRIEV